MICISVTPESRQLAKVDILNAARQSDLVELCLDRLLKEPDVKDLIDGSKKPILISCRRPEDGGSFKGTEDERFALLRQAIIAGPAYVELDPAAAKKIPRFGKVQRVISFSSMTRPLGDLEESFEEARLLQADVVKFTWPTETLEAAWPLLAVVSQKRGIPVVGLGIGRSGLTFSLLGRKYGSPWIYAALEKGMEAFPGQPTVTELDDVYRWRAVSTKTRFIGLAGFNSVATITAKILNAGFDLLNLETRCLPFDVKTADQLGKMLEILKVPAIIATAGTGSKMMSLATKRDDASQATDYADVLLKQPEGWQSFNLIWKLALRHLEDTIGKSSPEDRPLDRRNVLVLGGGGLGHSMTWGVKRRSGLVSIAAGDDEEAQQLAQQTDSRFIPVSKCYDTLCDVLVVTVPNLDHLTRKTPINPSIVRPGMTVLDISQLPQETSLTDEARMRGAKVVGPAELYADYLTMIFKSLTGQELPAEAFAVGLSE